MAGVFIAVALPPAAVSEDNRAAARLEAMATFLAKTKSLSVAADCSYDVVQDSGQKIEFGERREMTLRRPDRARIDVTRRDGSRRGVLFDGTQLTAFDLDEKVYATVPKPGTADAAFAYFTQDLNMRLPLRGQVAQDQEPGRSGECGHDGDRTAVADGVGDQSREQPARHVAHVAPEAVDA